MCAGAGADAAVVADGYVRLATAVNVRLTAAQAAAAERRGAAGAGSVQELGQAREYSAPGVEPGDDASIEEIQDYFVKRQRVCLMPVAASG